MLQNPTSPRTKDQQTRAFISNMLWGFKENMKQISIFYNFSTSIWDKYSLLMHCIKIKSRAKSLLNEQYVFVGGNISFLCVLSCISEEA